MRRLVLVLPFISAAACGAGDDPGTGTPDAAPIGVQATFTSLYGDYFSRCSNCHAPGAPGRTADIEMNLDFSSKSTAFTSITTKMAAGLTGNFSGCNGVPFVNADPAKSLLLASLDQPARTAFDDPAHASCDGDSIADQTLKVGSAPSAAFIVALKGWLQAGAPNN